MSISKAVKDQFIQKYPQWVDFVSTVTRDGEEAIVVEVLSPSQTAKSNLSIDTFGDEITVSFDAYHIHVDDHGINGFDRAWAFINQVVSDSHAVVSYWRDAQWCGSNFLSQSEFPSDNSEYPYANLIRIRSWSGAVDNDIVCKPRD